MRTFNPDPKIFDREEALYIPKNGELSLKARLVYSVLMDELLSVLISKNEKYKDEKGNIFFYLPCSKIGKFIGLCEGTVRKYIKELIDLGAVERKGRKLYLYEIGEEELIN